MGAPPPAAAKARHLRKSVIAIIVAAAIVVTSVMGVILLYPKPSSGSSGGNSQVSESEGSQSGSKPVDVTPAKGLRIQAPANALDRDRTFKATLLDEESLNQYGSALAGEGIIPVWGYDVDAGMQPDEIFPGSAEMSMDLRETGVPVELWNELTIVRLGEDGIPQLMNTYLEGSLLKCRFRQNCLFFLIPTLVIPPMAAVVTTVGVTLTLSLAYFTVQDHYYRKSALFGDLKVSAYSLVVPYETDNDGKPLKTVTYRLFWPARMGVGNEEEVKRVYDGASEVMNELMNSLYPGRDWNQLGVFEKRDFLAKRDSNSRFKENCNLIGDPKWERENVLPKAAQTVCDSLTTATDYLYNTNKRGFNVPNYTIDVLMFDAPNDELGTAYALEKDLATTSPFILVNLSDQKIKPAKDNSAEKIRNDMSMAIVHELFHVTEKEYYTYLSADKISFLEAAAITLEKEARAYYENNNLITKIPGDNPYFDIDDRYETLALKAIDDSGEKYMSRIISHGYTLSPFFDYLRDSAFNKKDKDGFLKRVMESYSGLLSNPVYALHTACGNTEQELKKAFGEYCKQNTPNMVAGVVSMIKKDREQLFPELLADLTVSFTQTDSSIWEYNTENLQPLSWSFRQYQLPGGDAAKNALLYFLELLPSDRSAGTGPIDDGVIWYLEPDKTSDWSVLRNGELTRVAIGPNTGNVTIARADTNTGSCTNPRDMVALLLCPPAQPAVATDGMKLNVTLNALPKCLTDLEARYDDIAKPGYYIVVQSPSLQEPRVFDAGTAAVSLNIINDGNGSPADVSIPETTEGRLTEAVGTPKEAILQEIGKDPTQINGLTVRYAETVLIGGKYVIGPLSAPVSPSATQKKWVLVGSPEVEKTEYDNSKLVFDRDTASYEFTEFLDKEVAGQTSAKFTFTPPPNELSPGVEIPFTISGTCTHTGFNDYRTVYLQISLADFRWSAALKLDANQPGAMKSVFTISADNLYGIDPNKTQLIYYLDGPGGHIKVTYFYQYQ